MRQLLTRLGHNSDHESFIGKKLITLLSVNFDKNATHRNIYPAQLKNESNFLGVLTIR